MINLDQSIEAAKEVEDIKVILRQIVSAVNQLETSGSKARRDVVFPEDDSGPVVRADDGAYYRLKAEAVGGTFSWSYAHLGKTVPE